MTVSTLNRFRISVVTLVAAVAVVLTAVPLRVQAQQDSRFDNHAVHAAATVEPEIDSLTRHSRSGDETIYRADRLPVSAEPPREGETGIQLVQGLDYGANCYECGAPDCQGGCGQPVAMVAAAPTPCGGECGGSCGSPSCGCVPAAAFGGAGYGGAAAYDPHGNGGRPGKLIMGVDASVNQFGKEPGWGDQHLVPWEAFAYGEYIGPHRTPHVPEYRLRVDDQLEFVYIRTRERTRDAYRIYVGDSISITSGTDAALNQPPAGSVALGIGVLSDGSVMLPLIGSVRVAGKTVEAFQRELNERYTEFIQRPQILVQVVQSDTPLADVIASVDATAGQGGQLRQAVVSPDGTIQLPLVGSVPAVGLTLDEIRREVNARYRLRLRGIEVTPVLTERAARFVYVVGEMENPGQIELTGPTTVLQALASTNGQILDGANLRNIVVLRRDQNWRLMATRLDLAGALYGRRPFPTDDIWLRDSDIVIVPAKPIQRLGEAINQYFTNGLFGLFPAELGSFDAAQVIGG